MLFWCSTNEASCLDLFVDFVCSYVNTFLGKFSFSNQFIQSKENRRSIFTVEITKPLDIGVPGLVEIQWSIHSVLDYGPGSACRCKEEISHKTGLSIWSTGEKIQPYQPLTHRRCCCGCPSAACLYLVVFDCWEPNSRWGLKCWRPRLARMAEILLLTRSWQPCLTNFNKCKQRRVLHRASPCRSVYTSKHIPSPCHVCTSVFPASCGEELHGEAREDRAALQDAKMGEQSSGQTMCGL